MSAFNAIQKYDEYNDRMAKSMLDKLFFLDKVNARLFVDFGCADGTLFKYMRPYTTGSLAEFIGYDLDPEMCRAAFKKLPPQTDNDVAIAFNKTSFVNTWDEVASAVDCNPAGLKSCLILSSVIHEVYNYSDPATIDLTWNHIWRTGFDYIVIRDMMPSETIDRASDPNDVAKVLRKYRDSKELKDFERKWGNIMSNKNLVHFLLKYKYIQPNWAREVKENYLPLYSEDMMAMIPADYNITYQEHYTLPYLKRCVRNDFGIELKDQTHMKMILERNA